MCGGRLTIMATIKGSLLYRLTFVIHGKVVINCCGSMIICLARTTYFVALNHKPYNFTQLLILHMKDMHFFLSQKIKDMDFFFDLI
jgi:hypothetical protein